MQTYAIKFFHLAVPLRRSGELDIARAGEQDDLVRYEMRELQTRNVASNAGDPALLEVAALRTRFLLQSDATHAYACVPLAQIVECRADKQVVLDDSFIPTVMHTRTASRLATLTSELLGLFHQRGEVLGGRVAATGRGGAAEFGEFLDAAGDQPLRTFAGALRRFRRASSRGAVSGLRIGGR